MNPRVKVYLILFCAILIFGALVVFIIKPFCGEIKKTAASVLESRERLISLERMDRKYIEEVEKDYENISANIVLIESQFIDKNEAVKFFEALELVASATSNKIEINASEFPVLTLGLEGTHPDLMKFVGWLENGENFIDIEKISISRASQKQESENILSGIIKTNLKIKAYLKE